MVSKCRVLLYVILEESESGRPPLPAPCLLIAEDFAVVENLDLQHLISVDAAGHRPPERLRREEQLWPWVQTAGRC